MSELLVGALVWAVQIAIFARFMSRFGYSSAWAIAAAIPGVPLIMIWYVAFAPWPIPDRSELAGRGSKTDTAELVEAFR